MMIDIDGSQGEGGGQILRSSLALSLLTGKPFRLRRVRANRPKPGLQPQHLMSVKSAGEVGKAKLRGFSLRSEDLTFEPGKTTAGEYRFAIGTAGATSLVLHTIYLPLLRAAGPSTVRIEGGTHVKTSPTYHFLERTWQAYLRAFGIELGLKMTRPGFYPCGGGSIEANLTPATSWKGFVHETSDRIKHVTGFSAVASLPMAIAERQAIRAEQCLRRLGLDVELRLENWPGGPGTVVGLELPTSPAPTTFFAVGERGKSAEKVADEAVVQVEDYMRTDRNSVDSHSADQILLPLALANGPSKFPVAEITKHLTTNADVIRRFLKCEIRIEGKEGRDGRVEIEPASSGLQ
ncbi:MAG: RNA 3'-phosphate cyclase [Gemmataceae bacterium]|nr:RNA 3'-phosphate cyclase [Gemmataceae bacterium]